MIGKIIVNAVSNKTKFFEVVLSTDMVCKGDKIIINGYPIPVEVDGNEYYLVEEKSVIAIIN